MYACLVYKIIKKKNFIENIYQNPKVSSDYLTTTTLLYKYSLIPSSPFSRPNPDL